MSKGRFWQFEGLVKMIVTLGLNRSSRAFFGPSVISRSCRLLISKRLNSNVAKTTFKQENQLLVAQRKHRPVSPHLTIYQPQITWYLSSLHRISGVVLGMGFFAVTMAFGVSTIFGLGLNTDNLKAFYKEKVPSWADLTMKAGAAYLFVFHFGNGIRHLVWDMGKELSIKGVNRTGIAVLIVAAIGGTSLLFK